MLAGTAPAKWKDPEGYELYVRVARANKLFVEKTFEHMDKIDRWIIKKGEDPERYWELFGELPNWLKAKMRTRKKNANKI